MAGSLLSARCITFIECRRSVRPRPYPGKGNAPLAPFYTENHLFYQDRLGTYIGTTQKKVAFSLALQLHEQARYDYPRGRIHRTATEALQVQVHWYDEHPCWDGWRCGTLCRAGCDNRDTLLLRAAPGERDSKKKRPLSLSLSLSLSLFSVWFQLFRCGFVPSLSWQSIIVFQTHPHRNARSVSRSCLLVFLVFCTLSA
jgi:hypothetical protein